MSQHTIDLLNDLAEFLEDQADVRDGSYGEQVPNREMQLLADVEAEIERLKNAAPQPLIAKREASPSTTVPSDEGVGRGDVAVAASTATSSEGKC